MAKPYIILDDKQLKKDTKKGAMNLLIDYIKEENIITKDSIAIDLGCGSGHKTLALSHYFTKIYGIDESDHMLKDARKNKHRLIELYNNKELFDNVRFYKGDFMNIPISKVDVIFMFNSIHFADNIEEALNNIFTHLKKDGLICITEPHNKTKFSKSVMNNPKLLKKKLNRLKMVREDIQSYIKKFNKNVVVKIEKPNYFFIIIK